MKTRILLLTFLLLTSVTGFCNTITITASSASIFSFSPNNGDVNITSVDIVSFVLNSVHNAVEVSQTTWANGGSTKLIGGFEVDFGGGTVSGLSDGDHYYVCQPHSGSGMRGVIRVSSLGLPGNQLVTSIVIFPNPTTGLINIKSIDNSLNLPYRVIDQSGRMVFAGKLEDETTPIELIQLTSGIYFVQIGEVRRQTFKIIKK